jgi:hypothetical protein
MLLRVFAMTFVIGLLVTGSAASVAIHPPIIVSIVNSSPQTGLRCVALPSARIWANGDAPIDTQFADRQGRRSF